MLQIDGKMWQKLLKRVLFRFGIRVEQLRPRPYWSGENERFSYQSAHVKFSIRPKDKVLDIGSGAYPFPYATVLVERFIGKTEHRHDKLVTNGKPLAIANISALPFRDKHFDFVYCSHVLEHVEEPIRACAEIMRVGRRGYIETPTLAKDMLFAWQRECISGKWQRLPTFSYSSSIRNASCKAFEVLPGRTLCSTAFITHCKQLSMRIRIFSTPCYVGRVISGW
jgi:SAM-dependent methyltransferase